MKDASFEVYIEMSAGSDPVKYEIKDGHFHVKRIIPTSLKYPTNYGYISETLAGDGDALDALILSPYPLVPRSRIECRALGALDVDDQEGKDYKVLAVPVSKVFTGYDTFNSWEDIPMITSREIAYFFREYKKAYTHRWSKVNGWVDQKAARKIIRESIREYFEQQKPHQRRESKYKKDKKGKKNA